MLTQSWDFTLEEHEAKFRDDLRAASGVGKRGRKKGKRVCASQPFSLVIKSLTFT